MPELPEVEHVRQHLERWMLNARIVEAHANDRLVVKGTLSNFAKKLAGRTVLEVGRRGKWLRLLLDDDTRLFGHLGMTGDFTCDSESERFERARFMVERATGKKKEKSLVRYTDTRRWGRLIVSKTDIATWTKLGPDPLLEGIDFDLLTKRLQKRARRTIKEVLMDQTVLAGVGNIQAIEALWKAEVDPRSNAAAIGHDEGRVRAIIAGLKWTIQRTLDDLAKGDDGADNPFEIYGRKGTPCPRCKTLLKRIELGGRTTTFCPGCQALLKARKKRATTSKKTAKKKSVTHRRARASLRRK